ncbi:MAG: PhoPQ-activated pathogenicity-related family protein [Planctomycetia bacterium]|nr:PhoPQ-activated pathogenicity-related family protein [Planctomycetia bacterium]
MSRVSARWAHAILLVCAALFMGAGEERTALDEYVAAPDPNYGYKLVNSVKGDGYTTYILEMTSQAWRSPEEVNRTIWKHWLSIVKPNKLDHSTGLMYITGGNNNNPAPTGMEDSWTQIAMATKTAVAELRMVPNQPLVFAGETQGRSEDAIIAYTWDKFMRTGDQRWPLRLPMTKSAVRGMDTITAFLASPDGGKAKVDNFVVCGGSKRGWTTWTTAVVDKRVVGIMPLSIDLLNIEPSFKHHWEAYGFWAPAVGNYVREGIMNWHGTPEYRALMKIEEPYEYRDRLTMPKFIMQATGDQFFLPDSSQFYFDDLPGVKYLRYVPNAEHGMRGSDVRTTILACYNALLTKASLPKFAWILKKDGSLHVNAVDKPAEVKLWQATNPEARDFRLQKIGPVWKSSDLAEQGTGVYIAKVPEPPQGWTAFMVELTYPNGTPAPYKFTTQVHVVPDKLPFTFSLPANPAKGFLQAK